MLYIIGWKSGKRKIEKRRRRKIPVHSSIAEVRRRTEAKKTTGPEPVFKVIRLLFPYKASTENKKGIVGL